MPIPGSPRQTESAHPLMSGTLSLIFRDPFLPLGLGCKEEARGFWTLKTSIGELRPVKSHSPEIQVPVSGARLMRPWGPSARRGNGLARGATRSPFFCRNLGKPLRPTRAGAGKQRVRLQGATPGPDPLVSGLALSPCPSLRPPSWGCRFCRFFVAFAACRAS